MDLPRSEATVEQLLQLLPGMEELEILRLRLIASAVPDPGKAWDSSSAYATVDKRILTPEDVMRSLDAAEAALRDYVSLLHDGLRPAFRAFFAGDAGGAARHLVALGEEHEGAGRARGAYQCYRAALALALPLGDKGPQILALRRLGRVALSLAQFAEATASYERSAELARDSGDLRSEVVARTGAGNVSIYQGRWAQAERTYREALELVDSSHEGGALALERGQLFNNLGNVATRVSRLDEAEAWLGRALSLWREVSSPGDEAVCLMNLGHLRETQGRLGDTRAAYEAALALPIPPAMKSLVAADLAEVSLKEGYVARAEELARVSEEHAIASSSPYTLGYMYRSRGNLARANNDEDGFTFYEKALEIARDKGYPSLEAETLADYAVLRRHTGGGEEAEAYLERARELFEQLGAAHSLASVRRALEGLRGASSVPATASGN